MISHSIIAPSSAGIWGATNGCTAWPLMAAMYPETETLPETMDGEATHEISATMISAATRTGFNIPLRETIVGTIAENGVVIDDDMYDAAVVYANDVSETIRDTYNFNPQIEQRVDCPDIHEQSFGTPDCWLYDKKSGVLYIWDFKYGFLLVEVFENWQMLNYLSGILRQIKLNGHDDQHITVKFRVVQPRAFHRDGEIREWSVMVSSCRGYLNTLHNNAAIALDGDKQKCRTGSHCRYCSARHSCEAALTGGMLLYEVSTKPTPIELSVAALGVQLNIITRAKEHIKALETGFSTKVEQLIKRGENVPGWIVEPTYTRENWSKPIKEVIALGELLGVDLKKPSECITPNQARKKGIDGAVIHEYSGKQKTGVKLTLDNDNKVKRIFGI